MDHSRVLAVKGLILGVLKSSCEMYAVGRWDSEGVKIWGTEGGIVRRSLWAKKVKPVYDDHARDLLKVVDLYSWSPYTGSAQKTAEKYQEEAGQIYTTVFHKYDKRVRPPDYYPDPVLITVQAKLIHIRAFDLLTQELETVLELGIDWQDKRLAWYANQVDTITVDVDDIWSPSIFYSNGVKAPVPLFDSKAVITSDGNIKWYRRELVTTLCPTLLQNSTQTCPVSLSFTSEGGTEQFDNTTEMELDLEFANHYWGVDMVVAEIDDSSTVVDFVLDLVKLEPPDVGRNCSLELGYDVSGIASLHVIGSGKLGFLVAFWVIRRLLFSCHE